jgi:hypothetical protein
MDRDGLIDRMAEAVEIISEGRRWLDTEGREAEGRLRYHEGLAIAMGIFLEALSLANVDPGLLMLLELGYLMQELHNCDPGDAHTIASLERAIAEIEDALRALGVVGDRALYRAVEMTYPRKDKFRKKGMPKDAFHIACDSHLTRIGNILKSPGINLAEKGLLEQRAANLRAAQAAYFDKQRAALGEGGEDGGRGG